MATLHVRSQKSPEGSKEIGSQALVLCGRQDVPPGDTFAHGQLAEGEARRRGEGNIVCPACLDVEESRQTLRR
jgi:hypothetical protein